MYRVTPKHTGEVVRAQLLTYVMHLLDEKNYCLGEKDISLILK